MSKRSADSPNNLKLGSASGFHGESGTLIPLINLGPYSFTRARGRGSSRPWCSDAVFTRSGLLCADTLADRPKLQGRYVVMQLLVYTW